MFPLPFFFFSRLTITIKEDLGIVCSLNILLQTQKALLILAQVKVVELSYIHSNYR